MMPRGRELAREAPSSAAKRETAAASLGTSYEMRETRNELRERVGRGATRLKESSAGARERGRQISRCARLDMPWARCGVARILRETLQRFVLEPLMTYYTRRKVSGRERFESMEPPVVFVANHSSHMDTPAILRALPWKWRHRTAVAAAADYFYRDRRLASLVSLLFNTVPVAREGGGGDGELAHVDQLLDDRWNLLLFPEGTRSRGRRLKRMRSGAAVLAARHDSAIVPIHVIGTDDAMPPGQVWPRRKLWRRRYPVRVAFGDPIRPVDGETPRDVTARVQDFFERQGAAPAERIPAPVAAPAGVGR
jgi:1-acyl-sn-glycerol-3-phosphate acyltransferase